MARSRSPVGKPRRSYHHGNLRRALLDEALATIRAEGVEGLTLREIGARLGVSRTALYRHFADKGALLEAVATEGFRTLRQKLVDAWEGGRGPAGFDAMGQAYVRFAVASPSHYRVMFGGFVDDPEDRQSELAVEGAGAFQALVDALTALQRDGLVRADDTETMASFVWSVVHGVATLCIDGQLRETVGAEQLTRYALERLWSGIGVRDDRRPARAYPEPRR